MNSHRTRLAGRTGAWIVTLGLAVVLGACAHRADTAAPPAAASPPQGAVQVSGSLTYRARIALPPQARAIVELRQGSSPDGAVIARTRIDLAGRQVPVPFVLDVPAGVMGGAMAGNPVLTLRGIFTVDEQARWTSEPLRLGAPAAESPGRMDVGPLMMLPVRAQAFSAALQCGTRQASVATLLNEVVLRMEGRSMALRDMPAASGVSYEALDDPRTTLRMKGDSALLSLDGRTLPECQVRMAVSDTLRERAEQVGSQLIGKVWTVRELGGSALQDGPWPTLSFDSTGRLSGSAGCNSYNAQYRLSGESIDISRAATTLRACAPAASQREAAFLAVLRDAQRVELAADGALLIRAAGRLSLRAQ